jgi:hypothetical protein
VINDYDVYYLDRTRERPLPVVLVRLRDSGGTRYYIDPKTARGKLQLVTMMRNYPRLADEAVIDLSFGHLFWGRRCPNPDLP